MIFDYSLVFVGFVEVVLVGRCFDLVNFVGYFGVSCVALFILVFGVIFVCRGFFLESYVDGVLIVCFNFDFGLVFSRYILCMG